MLDAESGENMSQTIDRSITFGDWLIEKSIAIDR